jgi:two-component system, cell cycle response regulator CtrA
LGSALDFKWPVLVCRPGPLKDAAVLTTVKEWPGSAEQVDTLLCRPSLTAAALAGFCFRRSRRKNGSAGVKQKNEPLATLMPIFRDHNTRGPWTIGWRISAHKGFVNHVSLPFSFVYPGADSERCSRVLSCGEKANGMRVLLIEDDSATAQSIELMLKSEGFNVYTTDLGEEGLDLGKLYEYEIILLDLNLPDMSGFDVLRSLRVAKVKTPILILSGIAGIEEKVRGLGYGADDYMTKPFHKNELVARIHAIVRRSRGHAQSIVTVGDLVVNLDAKTVDIKEVRIHLTGKEYQILEFLCLRKGTTLTKEMVLSQLYGGMDEPEIKIIDVYICKLRKKLAAASNGKDYIETIWGRGYVMRDPDAGKAHISAEAFA